MGSLLISGKVITCCGVLHSIIHRFAQVIQHINIKYCVKLNSVNTALPLKCYATLKAKAKMTLKKSLEQPKGIISENFARC
jgi:hypothetical protein